MTDDNGLYYMRARYYNPEIKRFMSRDVLLLPPQLVGLTGLDNLAGTITIITREEFAAVQAEFARRSSLCGYSKTVRSALTSEYPL